MTDGSEHEFGANIETTSLNASDYSPTVTLIQADGGSAIDLVDAEWILKAGFDRQGFDLKIEGDDGHLLLIRDYFAQAEPADLSLNGGEGFLRGAIVERLAGPAAFRPICTA